MAKRRTRRRYSRRKPAQRTRRRYRRNPVVRAKSNRRRRRYRRNPILPTRLLQQALTLGAGYLAAPMVSNMVPWQPATKLGQYAKTAVVVTIGSQLVSKALGKRYGNALMAGGWLWIAVDALQSQVPFFGGAQPSTDMGYYYPPDSQLIGMGLPELPSGAGVFGGGTINTPTFVH